MSRQTFTGDELNIPQAGRNYGWPVVNWGKHYDGTRIPAPPTHPEEFADAIAHWTPVISPSGIAFPIPLEEIKRGTRRQMGAPFVIPIAAGPARGTVKGHT